MVRISEAAAADVPAVGVLVDEMNRFYGDESAPASLAAIEAALFGTLSVHALLAWGDDDEPIGLATYSYLWPAAGVTPSLYLKELYVAESQRRAGIGAALMLALVERAAADGCSRVEWTTDVDNTRAQLFYDELGYRPLTTKVFYRLDLAESDS